MSRLHCPAVAATERCFRFTALIAATLLAASCGGSGRAGGNPVAPTPVGQASAQADSAAGNVAGVARPSAVGFPSRDESLWFRLSLEAEYRDQLRRLPGSTYVDPEGTVVWTQEYLRYRVNGCPHLDAVSRVMSQIDGAGAMPLCADTSLAQFPPRDESYDFILRLETKYQNSLRRPATQTYVDPLGTAVWTQEYLRYRILGECPASISRDSVFDQIEGRVARSSCRTAGSGIVGIWDGAYQRGGGFTLWVVSGASAARYTGYGQAITDYPTGVSQSGTTYTFDLYFGDTGIQLVATWDGADTMAGTTRGSSGAGPFTMRRRR